MPRISSPNPNTTTTTTTSSSLRGDQRINVRTHNLGMSHKGKVPGLPPKMPPHMLKPYYPSNIAPDTGQGDLRARQTHTLQQQLQHQQHQQQHQQQPLHGDAILSRLDLFAAQNSIFVQARREELSNLFPHYPAVSQLAASLVEDQERFFSNQTAILRRMVELIPNSGQHDRQAPIVNAVRSGVPGESKSHMCVCVCVCACHRCGEQGKRTNDNIFAPLRVPHAGQPSPLFTQYMCCSHVLTQHNLDSLVVQNQPQPGRYGGRVQPDGVAGGWSGDTSQHPQGLSSAVRAKNEAAERKRAKAEKELKRKWEEKKGAPKELYKNGYNLFEKKYRESERASTPSDLRGPEGRATSFRKAGDAWKQLNDGAKEIYSDQFKVWRANFVLERKRWEVRLAKKGFVYVEGGGAERVERGGMDEEAKKRPRKVDSDSESESEESESDGDDVSVELLKNIPKAHKSATQDLSDSESNSGSSRKKVVVAAAGRVKRPRTNEVIL